MRIISVGDLHYLKAFYVNLREISTYDIYIDINHHTYVPSLIAQYCKALCFILSTCTKMSYFTIIVAFALLWAGYAFSTAGWSGSATVRWRRIKEELLRHKIERVSCILVPLLS